jgi:hypothetical protein
MAQAKKKEGQGGRARLNQEKEKSHPCGILICTQ